MLRGATSHHVAELRDLLARGALHGLPRITVGDTVTADTEFVVRVFLANLDRLGQTDGASPSERWLAEEHIRHAHQAVTALLAS